jgi:hypothetical protein
MSLLDGKAVDALDLPAREKGDPDRLAGLCRVGDAIVLVDRELARLVDHDDHDRYDILSRHFLALRREATAMRAWDIAEIALAGERVFSSAVLHQRGLSAPEREFFDSVRHVLEGVAADPDVSELVDMDVIGDALDLLLDDLGVE